MKLNGKTWGVFIAALLVLTFVESSNAFQQNITDKAYSITGMVITDGESTMTIQGDKGKWTYKITSRKGMKDKINITYTPKENEKGCKNIRLSQTAKMVAYDDKGEKVTSNDRELYKNPEDNPYEHQQDDYIEDENKDLVTIDHIKCEGDPFYNGNDTEQDNSSKGDATSKPPKPTTMSDTPGYTFDNKKQTIKKIVLTFETVAICADTGELLGSISWQCVSTPTDSGEITMISTKEDKPSETFKKALKKFAENHTKEGDIRWHCPETSDKIKGPEGILSNPWGETISEDFWEKWIKPEISEPQETPELPETPEPQEEDEDTIIPPDEGCKDKITRLNHGIAEGEEGSMTNEKILEFDESKVGGGQYFESPTEALDAGLNNIERIAIKFTWSGDQVKTVKGILFTSYTDISPEDVAPFIEYNDRFINDFDALEIHFLPTELMDHLLNLMTTYTEDLKSSDGPATVSIIANLGTKEAAVYTGALFPERVASFIIEAALHERVNQETLEKFHYIGLNFGFIMGSQDFPPAEFFVDPKTKEPNVIIVVGAGAAAMDVVSASIIAAKIGTMVSREAPPVVAMTDAEFDFASWKVSCNYNLILVGGPVANVIVKQLIDEGFSVVNWATSPGEWECIRAPYGNCNILIIAGADRDTTRLASQSLIQWM